MRSAVRGVRYDREMGEWLLRCDHCAAEHKGSAYWPLTLDFWDPAHGMSRCRACWHTYQRRIDHARRAKRIPRHRRYYLANRDVILMKRRAEYQEKRDDILMKHRARYARRRAAA